MGKIVYLALYCIWNFFFKKFGIVLIASITILLTCTTLNPPMKNYFLSSCFYLHASIFNCVNLLWSYFRISSFYENVVFLQESFWNLLICENLFLYMIICENLFLFMITCENLLEYLFAFYSLFENKQVYECHHLKQIFYHQNLIVIFRWLRMFQFYVFLLWSLLFSVWLLFY